MRHKTTSILAFEYLNPKDRENVFDSYLLTLPFLLKIISNTIHSWNNNPAEMGGDLTQLTLYIQALEATLLEKKGQLSRDVKKGISLIKSSLVRLSSTVLNRGVHLGTWGDHRVLSPLLQCALMLQTVSLSRDRESLICPDLTAKIIIPYAKKLLYRLTKHTDHSSLVTQIGIIDPWTVLSFLIAFLAASKDLAEDDIDAIRCLIWKYTPKLLNSDSNVLSSSIQWSIIIIGLSGLIPWHVTNKADENSSHAVDSEFEQMCIRRRIEFVSDKTRLNVFKVWKEKFQDISEPKKSIPFMPSNRFALLNKIKFSIQNYHLNPDEFVKHTTQLYGQMITKLDPEVLRLHIIIGGFSTSGKSTICQALIQSGAPVSILPRITTRTIRSDHPEIHLFKSVSRDSFNDLLERGMLVAPHELWG
ncbi:hypothetical protein KA005_51920, partial [bacterium]|nr:hypothetical protein [bacterium]